jgi:phage gpG-like protein
MMIKIDVEDGAIRAWMAKLQESGSNLRPALTNIGEAVRTSVYLRFRSGGPAPSGAPWAPLSAVTLAMRRKGKGTGGSKPLWSTGRLANSIHAVVDSNSVTVGTDVKYAAMQHFGARQGQFGRYSQIGRVRKYGLGTFKGSAGTQKGFPIPWGNVPGRPFLGISQEDRREIVGILQDFMAQTAK